MVNDDIAEFGWETKTSLVASERSKYQANTFDPFEDPDSNTDLPHPPFVGTHF